jgi:hypothetical protein
MREAINWVQALSKCTAREIFERLYLEILEDAKAANEMVGSDRFKVVRHNGSFVVFFHGGAQNQSVSFTIQGSGVIASLSTRKINASLILDKDGICKLIVAGQEYETWQFRQDALRELFFEFYS